MEGCSKSLVNLACSLENVNWNTGACKVQGENQARRPGADDNDLEKSVELRRGLIIQKTFLMLPIIGQGLCFVLQRDLKLLCHCRVYLNNRLGVVCRCRGRPVRPDI